MKKLVGILFAINFIAGCHNILNIPPFQAKVVAVYPKIDGTGYAIVLRAVDDPNKWDAAATVKKLNQGDVVTVDRTNGTILLNGETEGTIIKK